MSLKYHLESIEKEFDNLNSQITKLKTDYSVVPVIMDFPVGPKEVGEFKYKYNNKDLFKTYNKDSVSTITAMSILETYELEKQKLITNIIEPYYKECEVVTENNKKVHRFILDIMNRIGVKGYNVWKRNKNIFVEPDYKLDLERIKIGYEKFSFYYDDKYVKDLYQECMKQNTIKDQQEVEKDKLKVLGMLANAYLGTLTAATFEKLYNIRDVMSPYDLNILNKYFFKPEADCDE